MSWVSLEDFAPPADFGECTEIVFCVVDKKNSPFLGLF